MKNFRIETKPLTEPVTVDEVKLYARIAHSVEDSLIEKWITSARKIAEDYQHRAFITQSWILTYDSWPARCIDIPRSPLISIDSVKYYDEDNNEYTFDPSNYFVDTTSEVGRLSLNTNTYWPTTTLRAINGLEIKFTNGYGGSVDVPDDVKNAIYIYCTHMYENRESESGTIPKEFYDLLRPDRMVNR